MTERYSQVALDYFASHGIEPAVAAEDGVRAEGGALIYQDGRRRPLNGSGPTKTLQPKGMPLAPRFLARAPERAETVFVCEGESDALSGKSALRRSPLAGIRDLPVLTVPGTGCPPDRVLVVLIECEAREAYLAFDADPAGRSYSHKLAETLYGAGIRPAPVELPEGRDLADCIAAADDPGEWLANLLCNADAAAPPLSGLRPTRDDLPGTSWAPVDLGPVLAGESPVEPPSILARSDGVCLIYPARVHAVYGEPESGKGWLALAAAAERLRAGEHVVYFDFEDGPGAAVERLLLFGVEPEAIAARFHYVRPDEPLGEAGWSDLRSILENRPTLAVIDGLTEALTLHGLDLRDNTEVAKWLQMLPRPLQQAGCASLLVDHVTKDREARGRFAIGAQHKLAGVDVAYSLKVKQPLGRSCEGLVEISVRKDRPGHVRQHAVEEHVADLRLISDEDGEVQFSLDPPAPRSEFRPTGLMERTSRAIEQEPGIGKADLRRAVAGKNEAKDLALRLLVHERYVRVERDGQAHRHYGVRSYREDEDEEGSE